MAAQDSFIADKTRPIDADLDDIRDTLNFCLLTAAAGSIVIPGWDTEVISTSSPQDYSQPDSYKLTRGTRAIWINLTWANDAPASIQMCYDDGVSSPGKICFDAHSLTYDDDGNFKGPLSTLLNDLVSWWECNEFSVGSFGSPIVQVPRADSHGSNTATDSNTIASTDGGARSPLLSGKVARALDMSGEFLTIPSPHGLAPGSGSFSVACWVYADTFTGDMSPFSVSVNGGSLDWWLQYVNSTNRFTFQVLSSGTKIATDTNVGAPSTGTWYHLYGEVVAATHVGISVNNGTLDTTALSAAVNGSGGNAFIGYLGGVGRWWDGLVDEVAYWDRILTVTERAELYNSGSGIGYPG